MPHLGPIAHRNWLEAQRVREALPTAIQGLLKPGGGPNRISPESVAEALKSPAWNSIKDVPKEQLRQARQALMTYLAASEGAFELFGFREVALPTQASQQTQYADAARTSLCSYLPKADVDSARALKEYFADPSYVHLLVQTGDGAPHYTSGFTHDLKAVQSDGGNMRVIQLDYHELLEGKDPNPTHARAVFNKFIANAQRDRNADFLFVEVTPSMEERYRDMDPRFVTIAKPGAKAEGEAGDTYALLALPLSGHAHRALAEDGGKRVFAAYVNSWCEKNLEDGWKQDPAVQAVVKEMTSAPYPVWKQPPLPE